MSHERVRMFILSVSIGWWNVVCAPFVLIPPHCARHTAFCHLLLCSLSPSLSHLIGPGFPRFIHDCINNFIWPWFFPFRLFVLFYSRFFFYIYIYISCVNTFNSYNRLGKRAFGLCTKIWRYLSEKFSYTKITATNEQESDHKSRQPKTIINSNTSPIRIIHRKMYNEATFSKNTFLL